jgi:2-polyprenyl-6-methoxyphenol hydroxylase-like FAD-dependent oxidoreductase
LILDHGHQSLVRRSLGSDFPEAGPAQHFAVFELESSADLGDEIRIMFGERTTDVLWPLPDRYCRWSFEKFRNVDLSTEPHLSNIAKTCIIAIL